MTAIVGVSIAIPEPHATHLREKRASYGDSQAAVVPSHITLAPPLTIDRAQLGDVVERLTAVAETLRPFRVNLRGTDTFRPVSPVVFVSVVDGHDEIERLAAAVVEALDAPEPDFPFHPHVTVAHNLPDEALDRAADDLAGFATDFEVDAFHLYVLDGEIGWVPTHALYLGVPVA